MLRLLLGLLLIVSLAGCGSNSPVTGAAAPGSTVPAPVSGLQTQREEVLSAYYPAGLPDRLRAAALPVESRFPTGVRPFSTSQYGTRYVEGTLTEVLDIFDARPPENLAAFHQWAQARSLLLSPPPNLVYYTYAKAAQLFLPEFGYDAVLYRPDEYHPVFTLPTDTWMFVREDALANSVVRDGSPYFTSRRFEQRHIIAAGGFPMLPLDRPNLWPFYVQQHPSEFEPFRAVQEAPISGSSVPDRLNPYVPQPATPEQLARRAALGIGASPLSNRRNLRVASWETVETARQFVEEGFGFNLYTGNDDRYTWGTSGSYVVPLDPEFWR